MLQADAVGVGKRRVIAWMTTDDTREEGDVTTMVVSA